MLCFLFLYNFIILLLLFIKEASMKKDVYEITTEKIGMLLFAIQFPNNMI